MAIKSLALDFKNSAPDTIESVYVAPASLVEGTLITAFTAANNTPSMRSYKAYIYDSVGGQEAITPRKIVVQDTIDTGAGIVNHIIKPGGSLRVESDAALSISFFVTGNEI